MDFTTFILLLVAALVIALNVFAVWWFGLQLVPLVAGGGPYVPTRTDRLEVMMRLADITAQDVVVDMGSGDGRLVIAAARAGAKLAVGYEIHHGLVLLSHRRIKQAGLEGRARVEHISMWKADLHDTTLVFLYQVPHTMRRLAVKLRNELPEDARIVSHGFELPGWKERARIENVILYVRDPSTRCARSG